MKMVETHWLCPERVHWWNLVFFLGSIKSPFHQRNPSGEILMSHQGLASRGKYHHWSDLLPPSSSSTRSRVRCTNQSLMGTRIPGQSYQSKKWLKAKSKRWLIRQMKRHAVKRSSHCLDSSSSTWFWRGNRKREKSKSFCREKCRRGA